MKRKFQRTREKQAVDVDITSLLDILTILLVFLLMSYNASDLKLDLEQDLDMADSTSLYMTRFAPVVQINKHSVVFVNNKEIGRLPASGSLTALTEVLKAEKVKTEKNNATQKQQYNPELVNLVFDKSMDYSQVQRVMHDSALAGFSQFKFVVKGDF